MTKTAITRGRLQEISEDGFLKHGESKELARMALAAMDGEPVAEVYQVPNVGICAALGPSIRMLCPLEPGTKLYRHAQPAPVAPEEMTPQQASRSHGGEVRGYRAGWNACRAALLERQLVDRVDEKSLTSINPAPDLVSLQKKAESIIGNYPGIPDGYVMVPKEPTEAMMLHNSGCQHHAWDDPDCAMRQTRRLIWSHMLAAAPQEVK
ncbi:hypothetical protein [Klebsiella pneumoniae]|uniref:hypothetical protein n=1 Tax=Klebsiella pneumoniae TaxID=573 RepID=UPI000DE71975|nr:hypothetical protein [Klebsiella pneumoniae]MEA4205605.1 hypothetical protein [Klebsiella pneumoniae]SSG29601.1 Uncharacterised protein [Klebsiella pneumoniae]